MNESEVLGVGKICEAGKLFTLDGRFNQTLVTRDGRKAVVLASLYSLQSPMIDGVVIKRDSDMFIGFIVDNDGYAHDCAWNVHGETMYPDSRLTDIVGIWVNPLGFDHWKSLNSKFKFIAKSKNDSWYAFESRPKLIDGYWTTFGGGTVIMGIFPDDYFPDCVYTDSLIPRPEE